MKTEKYNELTSELNNKIRLLDDPKVRDHFQSNWIILFGILLLIAKAIIYLGSNEKDIL